VSLRIEHEEGEPRFIQGIPNRPQEELRQLVSDLLSGAAVSSDQVPPNMTGMVFLPVAMGAFQPPEELRKAAMGSAGPPERLEEDPPRPEHPGYPEGPGDPPEKPMLDVVNPQLLKDVEWGEVDDEALMEAQSRLKEANNARIEAWDKATREWDEAQEANDRERRRIDTEYREALASWEASLDPHKEKVAERKRLHDEWVTKHDRIFGRWGEEMGALVGWVKDAFPRGVNGYPMFYSVQVVNNDDWKRVRAALEREQERRKEIEV